MARPKKQPEEKRETILGVRLTARERAELDSRAALYGLTAAEFIRHRTLGYRLSPTVAARKERSLHWVALMRLGVNLNQIAHRMNAGQGAPAYLTALLERIEAEMDKAEANIDDSDFV